MEKMDHYQVYSKKVMVKIFVVAARNTPLLFHHLSSHDNDFLN